MLFNSSFTWISNCCDMFFDFLNLIKTLVWFY
jgi:hypothetical protein